MPAAGLRRSAHLLMAFVALTGLIAPPTVWAQDKDWSEFELGQDLQENTHRIADYAGKAVVLHFWATWCPHCRREIPKLLRVRERFGDKVQILTVSVDENLGALKSFVREQELPYPVIADTLSGLEAARRFMVNGIPVTYIFDGDGEVVQRKVGPADIETNLELLLEPR